jgi:hypothetical protein
MTPAEHLAMAYPALAGAPDEVTTWALAVAQDYRPSCLSEERQNLAQAHYAAYLLMVRSENERGVEGEPSRPGVILEEKEGDDTVKYAAPVADGSPSAPYDCWKALRDICARGAIITRFG